MRRLPRLSDCDRRPGEADRKLVLQRGQIISVDGIGDLIGFLDRVWCNRREILLRIPWASIHRIAQAAHDLRQGCEIWNGGHIWHAEGTSCKYDNIYYVKSWCNYRSRSPRSHAKISPTAKIATQLSAICHIRARFKRRTASALPTRISKDRKSTRLNSSH